MAPQAPQKKPIKEKVRILLDTNILYKYYLKRSKYTEIKFILDDYNREERAKKKLVFYLPNICVPETFCKLYEDRYINGKVKEKEFTEARANFLSDLKRKRFAIYSYIATDAKMADVLCVLATKLFNESNDAHLLGTIDICVLAMASRFKTDFTDLCYLFTLDGNLVKAAGMIHINAFSLHEKRSIPEFLKIGKLI